MSHSVGSTQREFEAPTCNGNACGSVAIRGTYSGGSLSGALLNNSGGKAAYVTVVWWTVLGQMRTSTTVFPGETLPLDNPQRPYGVGVAIEKAVFNSKSIEDQRDEQSDATFYRAYCETEGKWLGNWDADQLVAENNRSYHAHNNPTHSTRVVPKT